MITQGDYLNIRSRLLKEPDRIISTERKYMEFLVKITLDTANDLFNDFNRANELLPFWRGYAPRQRGRAPKGTSIPWSEVGEKSLSSNLIRAISGTGPDISFPGLPFGGDVRFALHAIEFGSISGRRLLASPMWIWLIDNVIPYLPCYLLSLDSILPLHSAVVHSNLQGSFTPVPL